MVAATEKPPKKSRASKSSKTKNATVGVFVTKGGFPLGYARDLITISPGVDLTKPTYALGK
ncbi:MAG: hypothetical protein H7067_08705 [Burkholderiales bacterium]|nr:hypothetical protein [Opitutaceae bacterium]